MGRENRLYVYVIESRAYTIPASRMGDLPIYLYEPTTLLLLLSLIFFKGLAYKQGGSIRVDTV